MTPEQAQEVLDLIERAGAQHDARLFDGLERQLDASDRVIAQVAQLKLLDERDDLAGVISQLQEAALGADPT